MIVLRALGAMLTYPRQDLRHALSEIADVIRASSLIGKRERGELLELIEELKRENLLVAEERYVETFDRGRATSLYLFEHLHGDGRDRGDAMLELRRVYERAGFELATRELPDYLPVVLEYLSCRDLAEARAMLADSAHLLRRIGEALIARGSSYAAVLQALLAIAGEARIDAAAVPRKARENPDADWFEEPAFGREPVSATRQNRAQHRR